MLLDGLDVEPLRMNAQNAPEYCVVDTAAGEVYTLSEFLSGCRVDDQGDVPRPPVVALYACGSKRVVVKALPPGDDSREDTTVGFASSSGVLAPARIARLAERLQKGEEVRACHFTVVLLQYCGDSLHENVPLCRDDVLRVVAWTAAACQHLMKTARLVYTDFKPANVLCDASTGKLLLCDYGGMEFTGEPFGTATYPPPESPYGIDVQADERAVVYGLGVLLVMLHAKSAHKLLLFRPASTARDKARAEIEAGCAKTLGNLRDTVLAAVLRIAWAPGATIADVLAALVAARKATQ